jgi:hypothetical protein
MRCYVVLKPDPPLRPFVLSEWADETIAAELASNWRAAVLAHDHPPPELAGAVAAWKAGDDTAHAAWLAAEAASASDQDRVDLSTASGVQDIEDAERAS